MSELTLGVEEAFTGNPLKAARYKRKNQFVTENRKKDGEKII